MNRSTYFNYIEEKLEFLSFRIKNRGKLNLLDLHIYSETFFADIINRLLNCNLKNMNIIKQNIEGIDLIDEENKIIAQVSATCTKQKVEHSLTKNILKNYNDFHFIFIAISGNADTLRKQTFENPYNIVFSPATDIYDIKSILDLILNMKIEKQIEFYEFIKMELGNNIDMNKIDSNLATIINILSKENLMEITDPPEINKFEINRKIEFNHLLPIREIIDEYKVFYQKLDEKYSEFDKQGANKSLSVFLLLKKLYTQFLNQGKKEDEIFYFIIDASIEIIKNSKNYLEIPYEELEMCVSIIVVDAFIRCKIYKNPEGYHHVITR